MSLFRISVQGRVRQCLRWEIEVFPLGNTPVFTHCCRAFHAVRFMHLSWFPHYDPLACLLPTRPQSAAPTAGVRSCTVISPPCSQGTVEIAPATATTDVREPCRSSHSHDLSDACVDCFCSSGLAHEWEAVVYVNSFPNRIPPPHTHTQRECKDILQLCGDARGEAAVFNDDQRNCTVEKQLSCLSAYSCNSSSACFTVKQLNHLHH